MSFDYTDFLARAFEMKQPTPIIVSPSELAITGEFESHGFLECPFQASENSNHTLRLVKTSNKLYWIT